MKLLARAEQIKMDPSGYECCVAFTLSESLKKINCYMVLVKCCETEEYPREVLTYVEDGDGQWLRVGDTVEITLSIVFVNQWAVIEQEAQDGFVQPINPSSHTEFVATIMKIVDAHTVCCSIAGLGDNIVIERETRKRNGKPGDKISFSGEIKAQINCSEGGNPPKRTEENEQGVFD